MVIAGHRYLKAGQVKEEKHTTVLRLKILSFSVYMLFVVTMM